MIKWRAGLIFAKIFLTNQIFSMKNFLFVCLTIFFSGSTLLPAKTADEIIDSYFNAVGGKDLFRTIKSLRMDGAVKMQGMEIKLMMNVVHNVGARTDISFMGMDGWQFLTPTGGWSYMPFQGQMKPDAMPEDMVKEGQSQLDAQSELLDYAAKGHTVEYVGTEDLEGTECDKIMLISKQGVTTYYLFDSDSKLLLQTIAKQKAGGKETEVKTTYSDYKVVEGGFVFPHEMISEMGPLQVSAIKVNGPVDPSLFTLPAQEAGQGK